MENNSLTVVQAKEAELKESIEQARLKFQEKINAYQVKREAEFKNLPETLKGEQEKFVAQNNEALKKELVNLGTQHNLEIGKLEKTPSGTIAKLADKIIQKILA